MTAVASLFDLPKPSAKLCVEGKRLVATGACAEFLTEALRGEDRGNDFLFNRVRKECAAVTGFERAESNHCKPWDVETMS